LQSKSNTAAIGYCIYAYKSKNT